MIALLQRVSQAEVRVEGASVGKIDGGLLILLGVLEGDGPAEVELLADKAAKLRIFRDDAGKMNRSLVDVEGAALVVSQFTLAADCRKGRRPSFNKAAAPERATELYELFCQMLRGLGVVVETGRFGAMMDVQLTNDGPVTISLDSEELRRPRRVTAPS
jgi:D-aminoacyl-tRNA deacylase